MPNATGGCMCGATRYTVSTEPLFTAVCHCRQCQRQSGSAFSVVTGFPESSLVLTGPTRAFADRGDSGNAVARHFCGECGSPILSVLEAVPGVVMIKSGTLDEFGADAPAIEVFCDSAVGFMPALPGTARYPRSNLETSL